MNVVLCVSIDGGDARYKVMSLPKIIQKEMVIDGIFCKIDVWKVKLVAFVPKSQITVFYLELWDWDGTVNYDDDVLNAWNEVTMTEWFGSAEEAMCSDLPTL